MVTLCTLWALWWIPHLVKLAVHPHNGLSFRQRLSIAGDAVRWNCTRILAPGFVAIMSMARASSPGEWAALYYFGYEPDYARGSISGMTLWQWGKIVLTDLPPIVLQPLLIAWAVHIKKLEEEENIATYLLPARWVLGSVSAAFIGLVSQRVP